MCNYYVCPSDLLLLAQEYVAHTRTQIYRLITVEEEYKSAIIVSYFFVAI